MKLKAFTLLEAVITLGLTVLLIIMPTFTCHHYQKTISLLMFKRELITNWETLRCQCYLNDCLGVVKMNDQNIKFIVLRNSGSKTVKVNIPSFLKIAPHADFKINKRHAITPTTLSFADKQTHDIHRFNIQMGWGSIIYEKM